jgi:hypothetical protein
MPDRTLDWVRDVEIEDLLDKDVKLVYDHCGLDILIKLWEEFPSMPIYMSTSPLNQIKERYIIKELCRLLDVSERFVYKVLEKKGVIHKGQEGLFPAGVSD